MTVLKRGDTVLCIIAGDYGKPRPAIVVQSDIFNPTHSSVVVCPLTTFATDAPLFRLPLLPTSTNGISTPSFIMIDKISAVRREKIRERIGSLVPDDLAKLDAALTLWLGLR